MPKDMVNAYGIEDVEKGKFQEITINCFFSEAPTIVKNMQN